MKKKLSFVMLLLTLILIMAACSGTKEEESSAPPPTSSADNEDGTTAEEEVFELSLLLQARATSDDSKVLPIIEEFTNTKLDIRYVEDMEDVLPVIMASGDMPNVIGSWWYRQPYQVNAMRAGVFWDLTDYIDDYPNLSAIPDIVYENTALDGRVYGLPRMRAAARRSLNYRKDWLDNLGLPEPKTIDDVYEMLRAFTYDDPDGNGVDDTIGLSDRGSLNVGRFWAMVFGAPHNWGVAEDGTFYPAHETEEWMDAMHFVKKLFDEGIVPSDFPVLTDAQMNELVWTGRAGSNMRHIDNAYFYQDQMPDAEIGMISLMEGPEGTFTNGETGSGSLLLISKEGIETEDELRRVLQFFDDLGQPEMQNLLRYGIEGEHYEVVDGKAKELDPEGYARDVFHLRNMLITLQETTHSMEPYGDGIVVQGERMKIENLDYAVYDPTYPLVAETQAEYGEQLNVIIEDAVIRFILGEIDEDGWLAEVERWRSQGGDQMAKEFTELYAAQQKHN